MTGNLWQDWPVYFLWGAVVLFFAYIIIKSNMGEKEKKGGESSDKVNK